MTRKGTDSDFTVTSGMRLDQRGLGWKQKASKEAATIIQGSDAGMVGPLPTLLDFSGSSLTLNHCVPASLLLSPLPRLTVFPPTSGSLHMLLPLSGTPFLSLCFLKQLILEISLTISLPPRKPSLTILTETDSPVEASHLRKHRDR